MRTGPTRFSSEDIERILEKAESEAKKHSIKVSAIKDRYKNDGYVYTFNKPEYMGALFGINAKRFDSVDVNTIDGVKTLSYRSLGFSHCRCYQDLPNSTLHIILYGSGFNEEQANEYFAKHPDKNVTTTYVVKIRPLWRYPVDIICKWIKDRFTPVAEQKHVL